MAATTVVAAPHLRFTAAGMYRDRERGTAPKQLDAARGRSTAGERSVGAAAPCPAAYASLFGAEVGTGGRPASFP